MTTYPRQTIALNHRIVKPARVSSVSTRQVNPLLPVLLKVGELLARLTIQIGFIVLWCLQFGISINVRYGRYIITFDNMPIFGIDLSCTLFGSLIVVNSPFGYCLGIEAV